MMTFERGSVCTTADYALDANGVVHVVNSGRIGDPAIGHVSNITGTAPVADPSKPAEFTLQFDNGGPPGTYWIIQLGPVLSNMYQYSIVSDANGLTLFVLARDVDNFRNNYAPDVYRFLEDNDIAGRTTTTLQDESCVYPPDPFADTFLQVPVQPLLQDLEQQHA